MNTYKGTILVFKNPFKMHIWSMMIIPGDDTWGENERLNISQDFQAQLAPFI